MSQQFLVWNKSYLEGKKMLQSGINENSDIFLDTIEYETTLSS